MKTTDIVFIICLISLAVSLSLLIHPAYKILFKMGSWSVNDDIDKRDDESSKITPDVMEIVKAKLKEEVEPSMKGMCISRTELLHENMETGLVVYQINTSNSNIYRGSGDTTNWARYLVGDLKGFTYSDSWVDSESNVYFRNVTEDGGKITIHRSGTESFYGSNVPATDIVLLKSSFRCYKTGQVKIKRKNIKQNLEPLGANYYSFATEREFCRCDSHAKRIAKLPWSNLVMSQSLERVGDKNISSFIGKSLNTGVLGYLLKNLDLIPLEYKGKKIIFADTTYEKWKQKWGYPYYAEPEPLRSDWMSWTGWVDKKEEGYDFVLALCWREEP